MVSRNFLPALSDLLAVVLGASMSQVVAMAVDPAMIDRVFSNSTKLSTEAVKHFVTQLCAVSSQEVNHSAAATFRYITINKSRSRSVASGLLC